ncbi:hypothetical protein KP509_04G090100 [Ceratopteris richardii]|nr:hypothetical protein KP509_04G090100 [Ceratopteris richardii]
MPSGSDSSSLSSSSCGSSPSFASSSALYPCVRLKYGTYCSVPRRGSVKAAIFSSIWKSIVNLFHRDGKCSWNEENSGGCILFSKVMQNPSHLEMCLTTTTFNK